MLVVVNNQESEDSGIKGIGKLTFVALTGQKIY